MLSCSLSVVGKGGYRSLSVLVAADTQQLNTPWQASPADGTPSRTGRRGISARRPARALDLGPAGPPARLDELVQPRPARGSRDDPPVQQRRQLLGDLRLRRLAQLRLDAGQEGTGVVGERLQPRIVRRQVEGPVEGQIELAELPVVELVLLEHGPLDRPVRRPGGDDDPALALHRHPALADAELP